jgi:hypothetical protein
MKTEETDVASQVDVVMSIRRGLEEAKKGMGRPINDALDDLDRQDVRPKTKP